MFPLSCFLNPHPVGDGEKMTTPQSLLPRQSVSNHTVQATLTEQHGRSACPTPQSAALHRCSAGIQTQCLKEPCTSWIMFWYCATALPMKSLLAGTCRVFCPSGGNKCSSNNTQGKGLFSPSVALRSLQCPGVSSFPLPHPRGVHRASSGQEKVAHPENSDL